MIEFTAFTSFEEAQAALQHMEDRANADLIPAQIRLRDSFDEPIWWLRLTESFVEWGRAWTTAECRESSLASGCTAAEADEETDSIVDARKRGYLFGIAWSILEPRGTLGSTHVSQALPISEALWELAESCRWIIDDGGDGDGTLQRGVAEAIRAALTETADDGAAEAMYERAARRADPHYGAAES